MNYNQNQNHQQNFLKKEKESSLLSEKQKNKIIDAYHLQLQIHEAGILNEQILAEFIFILDTYFTKKPEAMALSQMVRHTRDKLFFLTLKEISLAYEFAFQDLLEVNIPPKLNIITNYRVLRAYATLSFPVKKAHREGKMEKGIVVDLLKGRYYFLQMLFIIKNLHLRPPLFCALDIWDFMVNRGYIADVRDSQMKFRLRANGDEQFNAAKEDIETWIKAAHPDIISAPKCYESVNRLLQLYIEHYPKAPVSKNLPDWYPKRDEIINSKSLI